MRLFAAIVPPAPVLDHAERATEEVLSALRAGRTARVSPRENWHLTTAFFGSVPDGALADLSGALAQVAGSLPCFDLALGSAGVFAGRVLWLGLSEGAAQMRAVMRSCAEASAAIGIEASQPDRSRAHMTIARARDGEGLAAAAAVLAVYRGPAWRATELTLMSSTPGQGRSGGSLYAREAAFPLAPVPGQEG